jgi:hypothetical protein
MKEYPDIVCVLAAFAQAKGRGINPRPDGLSLKSIQAGKLEQDGINLTVAFHTLTLKLTSAANSSSLFAGALLAWLLVMTAQFHFAIHALTLQLFLKRTESLVDIVIANHDLHKFQHLTKMSQSPQTRGIPHLKINENWAESVTGRQSLGAL